MRRRRALADKARAVGTRGREISRDAANAAGLDVPWARSPIARLAREGFLGWLLAPLMNVYMRRRSRRREVLKKLRGPAIFVANHSSHLDTPVILRALPRRWRSRTAVAAAADYFYKKRRIAIAVSLAFGTVPIARCGGGAGRDSLDHLERLVRKRWSVLMFPEGTRSRDGSLSRLRSGAVILAARRGVPIVPISVTGTNEAMPPGRSWPRRLHRGLLPRRYPVEVTFGDPIIVEDEADIESTKERVHAFFDRQLGTGAERAAAAARAVARRLPSRSDAAADEPAADEPAADEPVMDEPVTDEPVMDEPVMELGPLGGVAAEDVVVHPPGQRFRHDAPPARDGARLPARDDAQPLEHAG